MKIHYASVRLYVNAGMHFPTCAAKWQTTTDKTKVTCKRCLSVNAGRARLKGDTVTNHKAEWFTCPRCGAKKKSWGRVYCYCLPKTPFCMVSDRATAVVNRILGGL